MFGAIYKAGKAVDRVRFQSPVYYANTVYAKKLAAYILDEKFDAVVCTHLFAMEALTYIKKCGLLTVPSYGVLTDYTCIPFFEETRLDEYFIPHADLTAELCAKGMEKERLIPTGIPVSPRFTLHTEKRAAREMLGLPQDKKIVLVMTGGVGLRQFRRDLPCASCRRQRLVYLRTDRKEHRNVRRYPFVL